MRRREREWEQETPRRSDNSDVDTPFIKARDTPSHASWDEDDSSTPGKLSSWDAPTPSTDRRDRDFDHSSRSNRSGRYKETPLPTPTYKKNSWMKKGQTSSRRGRNEKSGETPVPGGDKDAWEEEQKRLDREWYSLDEGYDETNNPFSGVSEEYTRRKEEAMEAKKTRRLTAKQAQRHKDNTMWEKNVRIFIFITIQHNI